MFTQRYSSPNDVQEGWTNTYAPDRSVRQFTAHIMGRVTGTATVLALH